MLNSTYRAALRRALLARGIFGKPTTRLMQEIEDHFITASKELQAHGSSSIQGENLALETLGEPDTVAASAWENFRQERWMMRHPLLFGASLVPAAIVTGILIPIALAAFTNAFPDTAQLARPWVEIFAEIMNWLPILVAGGILYFLSRRYPFGWKALYAGVVGITLGLSFLGVWTTPHFAPGFGPADGHTNLTLECSPLGTMICEAVGSTSSNWGVFLNFGYMADRLFYFHLLLPILVLVGIQIFLPRFSKA